MTCANAKAKACSSLPFDSMPVVRVVGRDVVQVECTAFIRTLPLAQKINLP
jgi:hypothetical protein